MKAGLPRLGLRLHGGMPARACLELAQLADRLGLASLWFAENPFARGALPAAAVCALGTRHLAIGIGVVNPYSRHPTLIAMEAGTLDELSEGRVRLGIGSGIGATVRRMGLGYGRPLSAVRDAIHIVRALLRGESVTYRGRVFAVAEARLGYRPPRPDMPVLMAAMGDRGIALCGEIADGLIISNMCPIGYTERAAGILRHAAAKSGRPAPEIVQYVPCLPGRDRAEICQIAKRAVAEMLTAFWPITEPWPPWRETIIAQSGIARKEVAAALSRLRRGEPAPLVLDERYVDAFAIAGTAEECLERARAFRRAGVDELVLSLVGPRPKDDLAFLADALAQANR